MPSPENNHFADFINSLDDRAFSNMSDQVLNNTDIPIDNEERVKAIEVKNDTEFIYDLEVGLAHFRTQIDTDLLEGSVVMWFPSKVNTFEPDEMHTAITGILDAAYLGRHLIPRVQMRFRSDEKEFDLANYWEGRSYENAFKQQPLSLLYYIPKDVTGYPQGLNVSSSPQFMYGFSRVNDEDVAEFMKMSHYKGSLMDANFSQELLKRNRGYLGKDITVDSLDLRDKIQGLCKAHPQQTLGFGKL